MSYAKQLIHYASKMYNYAVHCVYPPICFYCKTFLQKDQTLCQQCRDSVKFVVSKIVPVTAKYQVKVFAISDYKDPLRSLILSKGYSDIVASRRLGQLVWDMTYVSQVDFDHIVPIPLHWTRFASRGFNQAQEIAAVIAKKSGKPMVHLLKRCKATRRQSALTSKKRTENLKDAFTLNVKNKKLYKDTHLLIVDDLMTTGSTIQMAARQLIDLKPKSITAVVVCRVV